VSYTEINIEIEEQDIKAMVCTAESRDPELSIWVEPANWEDSSTVPVHEVRLKVFHQTKGASAPSGEQVPFEHEDCMRLLESTAHIF
jgi:hypothetical protein